MLSGNSTTLQTTMPLLSSIRAANLSIGSSLPYRPVAISVGGTVGIGANMARTFARHRNDDTRIIIVGRNRAAAEEIIASFLKPGGKEAKYEFAECDATRNVRKTTAELKERLPNVNFLVCSPGIMPLDGESGDRWPISKYIQARFDNPRTGDLVFGLRRRIRGSAEETRTFGAVAEVAVETSMT